MVAAPPGSVVRAEGVICSQEEPDPRFTLHVTDRRGKWTPGVSWASDEPGSRPVFIGVPGDFDPAELSVRLNDGTEKPKT